MEPSLLVWNMVRQLRRVSLRSSQDQTVLSRQSGQKCIERKKALNPRTTAPNDYQTASTGTRTAHIEMVTVTPSHLGS